MQKAVFLDRDGVINKERGDYTYLLEDFELVPGVPEAIVKFHKSGFRIIVVTNQAGIATGLFTADQMKACHDKMEQLCHHLIDKIYYAPWHPSVSESLARKPGSLLFQRGIARFGLDPAACWMVGDRQRDIDPAKALGMRTIGVGGEISVADYMRQDLHDCIPLICS